MKRTWIGILIVVGLALSLRPAPGADPADSSGTTSRNIEVPPDTSWVFTVLAGSRLYPDWKEEYEVGLGEEFFLGDTQFRGVVDRFLPDFKLAGTNVENWSLQLENPAVHVYVFGDSGAVDSVWAFQNFPPHFSARSFFSFQLLGIDGYAPPAGGGDEEEQ